MLRFAISEILVDHQRLHLHAKSESEIAKLQYTSFKYLKSPEIPDD